MIGTSRVARRAAVAGVAAGICLVTAVSSVVATGPAPTGSSVQVEGVYRRLVAMGPDRELVADRPVLQTDDAVIDVLDPAAELEGVEPGTHVAVGGEMTGGRLVVDDVDDRDVDDRDLEDRDDTSVGHRHGTVDDRSLGLAREVLLIPVRLDTSVPADVASIETVVGDYADWVDEQTGGTQVTWLIAEPVESSVFACAAYEYDKLAAVLAQVEADGIDPDTFDNVGLVLIGATVPSGCYAAGWAEQPGRYSWYVRQYLSRYLLAHEMGHNWGLSHAGYSECLVDGQPVTLPVGGPRAAGCSNVEYGDPYSVMGSGRLLQGHEKNSLGLYGAESGIVETGTATDGDEYLLVGPTASSGRRVLGVRAPDRAVVWVEFSPSTPVVTHYVACGEFSCAADGPSTPGVVIRWQRSSTLEALLGLPSTAGYPHLLDSRPGSAVDFTEALDAVFLEGDTFTDPSGQVSVEVLEVGASSARVAVTVTTPVVRPGALVAVYAQYGDGRFDLSFLPGDPGDGTMLGLDIGVRQRLAGGTWGAWRTVRRPFASPQRITGLTNGIEHQMRVCPVSTVGRGACSSQGVWPYGRAPSPPRPRVRVGERFRVCMLVTNGGGPALISARVQRKVGTGRWRTMTTTPISLSNTTCVRIAPGTTDKPVQFRYSVSNSFGWSPWSSPSDPRRPS